MAIFTFISTLFCIFAVTAVLPNVKAGSNPRSARVADITWQLPTNTEFLDEIRVRFTSVPIVSVASRKRRAATKAQSVTTSSTATSTAITTAPFSDVTACVDAVYTGNVSVPLVNPITFQSAQDSKCCGEEVGRKNK